LFSAEGEHRQGSLPPASKNPGEMKPDCLVSATATARTSSLSNAQACPQPCHSDRARRPIVAPALRTGGTAEKLAPAARCSCPSRGEEATAAAGLAGIRRSFSVVVQLALSPLGLAEGAGFGADEILCSFCAPYRNPARRSSNQAPRQPPQGSATCLGVSRFLCGRTFCRGAPQAGHPNMAAIRQDYLRAACASAAAFLAAVRSSDFSPACAFASAAVSLAFDAESVVSGIAPFPSF